MRKDGHKGIRNLLLVIYTVNCAASVAREIVWNFKDDRRVDMIGSEGCRTNPLMTAKLHAFATHPNVGGVLVVGYGCEDTDTSALVREVNGSGRPAAMVSVQDLGEPEAVREGCRQVLALLEQIKDADRCPYYLSDIVIGMECGGSDSTSGLAANPLVGQVTDLLVKHDATVFFGEMYEAIGLDWYLLKRCVSERAKREIRATYDKYFAYTVKEGQFYISPGNVRGGLSTIEEKSMGAVIKTGSAPISGVLKLCQRPPHPGLWYVDIRSDEDVGCGFTVSNDASSDLLFATCGAVMCILTSGRGHVVNNPVIPTIKVTGNSETYERMKCDIDFDAGRLLDGRATMPKMLDEIMALIALVADGEQTKGEALGHREAVLSYESQLPGVANCGADNC